MKNLLASIRNTQQTLAFSIFSIALLRDELVCSGYFARMSRLRRCLPWIPCMWHDIVYRLRVAQQHCVILVSAVRWLRLCGFAFFAIAEFELNQWIRLISVPPEANYFSNVPSKSYWLVSSTYTEPVAPAKTPVECPILSDHS